MEFFNSAVDVLKTLVVALGAGLGVWGAVNLMEGYGGDNPSAKSQGILSIVIFVIVYGRMIEIYMAVSLAPIPMATWGNHEQSHVGQNYLRSLFALGFQGFLILICVAIYAVLLQNVAISGDAINSIWSIVGYTILLCFSLFKTSSVAKSILGAH